MKKISKKDATLLGMETNITRRDFLNGTLLGAGAALLHLPSPENLFAGESGNNDYWDGYGGVGDYANSHGNPASVMLNAHKVRDGEFDQIPADLHDTGEVYDLVVVGGGMSGLGAAYYFRKGNKNGTCLILDNHPVFGGASKQNEFNVNGQKLMAAQGANEFDIPIVPEEDGYDMYRDLGVPTKFEYQSWDPKLRKLEFDPTNFGYQHWLDAPSFGHYFEPRLKNSQHGWLRETWGKKLTETPYSEKVRADFLRARYEVKGKKDRPDLYKWLDSMSYKEFLEGPIGADPTVTNYFDPVSASAIGLGCDAVSALAAASIDLPGGQGYRKKRYVYPYPIDGYPEHAWHMFPGGNSGFARYFVKWLIPDSIRGGRGLSDVLTERINFEALDRAGSKTRLRMNATAVRVEHDGSAETSKHVNMIYTQNGKTYRVRAKTVIMAGGGWSTRRVVRDLPEDYREAYSTFRYAAHMVVNVAVTNWRFLYKLGLTGARWFDGFGYCCNLRRQMVHDGYRPTLHPDQPDVLTFYIPFYYPGLDVAAQGVQGRMELTAASYADYEKQIREQMVRLFGAAGFDPKKDIAGIILNRWGHAFLVPEAGFYYGRNGKPPARDTIRRGFGRIKFAHADLGGHQYWLGAINEGRRAAEQVLETL